MKVIKLSDIPLPTKGMMIIYIKSSFMDAAILERCEELGWMWANGLKPTSWNPWIIDWYLYLKPDGLLYQSCAKPALNLYSRYSLCTIDDVVVSFNGPAPRNNDGRDTCFWCGQATKVKFGFTNLYNICPKC